ncbi:DUF3298 domain-containing protein [Lentibacillus lipolyticus]|nr:DUF3298 domain-containing protein [Lentibacillus lipolyticus]
MIRRMKWPGWVVLLLVLAVCILGINQVLAKYSSAESDEPEEKTPDSSVYPGLNLQTKTKETDLYTTSISQPYTEISSINQPINQWINNQKETFIKSVKQNKQTLKQNDFRAHLNIQVDTQKIAEKIYTLEFSAYQIAGGANGTNTVKSFTIDLTENKILKLDDVLDMNKETIEQIQKLTKEALYRDKDVKPYIMNDLLEKALQDPKDWEWSINNKNMTLYFDEYEIAAGAAGEIRAAIPIDEIKPYLNETFAKKLDVKIPEKDTQDKEETDHPNESALHPDGKYIALTFDDGPDPNVTPRILETLQKHDAKATFFMLGSQVEYYPELANKVEEAGHEIGNHTMHHQDLTINQQPAIKQEVQQASDIIQQATGQAPSLFRPPYGASNKTVEKVAEKMDTPISMWSVDSLDWKSRNADAVHKEVMANAAPGSIVLLHDIHPSTADALPEVIASLEKEGYQMVTVSQLLQLWNEQGIGPYYGKIG